MSDPHDHSIPVLHEILVQGNPVQARQASNDAAEFDGPREPSFKVEPVLVAQPLLTPAQMEAVEPVLAAQPAPEDVFAPSAGVFDRAEPSTPIEAGAIVPPDVPHDMNGAHRHPGLDADLIAERLRGRFAGFLTGEGRGIIEARCREALQEHTTWLVNQITREVALTLETEMTGWVREAVEEEIARRSGSA